MKNRLPQLLADAKAEGWRKWIRSNADERAVLEGCYFDLKAGLRVVAFFSKYLRHYQGRHAGKPFVPLEFQRNDILIPLFGWKRGDGRRRFNRASIWMARGNGKTPIGSGIGLYGLVADNEASPEVYIAAGSFEQTRPLFTDVSKYIELSPQLSRLLSITPHTKTVNYGTGGWLKAISSEGFTAHGSRPNLIVLDELHAHKRRDLFDACDTATSKRDNVLLLSISTAGHDRDSIAFEEYQLAKQVLEDNDELPFSYFAYVAETTPEDDIDDPATWKKANPALGELITEEWFAEQLQAHKAIPAKFNVFQRYHLNQWTDSKTSGWFPYDQWNACDLGEVELQGKKCWAGVDLSSYRDLTAVVFAFPMEGEEDQTVYHLRCHFFLPAKGIDAKEREDKAPYARWAREGLLTLTPGARIDKRFVARTIVEAARQYDLQDVAIDPAGAFELSKDLNEKYGIKVENVRQGRLSMSEPNKHFESCVLGEQINHFGNEMLAWMNRNVTLTHDHLGNYQLNKTKSRSRIDGIVASVMAVERARRCYNKPKKASVYSNRGIIFL